MMGMIWVVVVVVVVVVGGRAVMIQVIINKSNK